MRSEADSPRRWFALLAVLCLAAFAPALRAGLFWDDHVVIRYDGPIADNATFARLLTGRCVLFPEGAYNYFRPVVDLSFLLEFRVAEAHPLLYHLTNLALHLGNALLALGLLRRIPGVSPWAAFAGAALFSLHPLQVESVLWPAARPAMLAVLFAQLAALAALGAMAASGAKRAALLAAGWLCYALSLGSKEVALVFGIAAGLSLAHPAARASAGRGALRLAVAGHLALLLGYLVFVRGTIGSLPSPLRDGLAVYLWRQLGAYGFYLRQLLWPMDLFPNYPIDWELHLGFGVAGAVVCGAVALALWRAFRSSGPAGGLAFAGLLLLAGGTAITHVVGQRVLADRYLYQAVWGLAAAFAAGCGVAGPAALSARGARLGLAALAITAALSLRQSLVWLSEESVWLHTIAIDRTNNAAHFNLGFINQRRRAWDAAILHLRESAEQHHPMPNYIAYRTEAAAAEATILDDLGRSGEADAARRFVGLWPVFRQRALVMRSVALFKRGDRRGALELAARFRDDGAQDALVHLDLALLHARAGGDPAVARRQYERALELGAPPVPELDALR
ncbi:MAG: hypothetical protein SF028_13825 [Candidatus Sumerlaeia bacterium]|nr:hypothetical protein [Candidatus Sumerlaeia bacterium]